MDLDEHKVVQIQRLSVVLFFAYTAVLQYYAGIIQIQKTGGAVRQGGGKAKKGKGEARCEM